MFKTTALLTAIAGLTLAGSAHAANLTWAGGAGTWQDGTQDQFNAAWNNANPDSAIFDGAAGTVSVSGLIDLLNLTFVTGSSNYTIDGGTLNFAGGGSINVDKVNTKHTITSTITGAPTVNIINGGTYEGLTFAPTSGTVALGAATIAYQDTLQGNGDKAGMRLGGSTTGNTVASVGYGAGGYPPNHYGTLWKEGTSTWTVAGDVTIGTIRVSGGLLAVNGTIDTKYQGIKITGGALGGNATILENFTVSAGGALAPGNSIGTMTAQNVTWNSDDATAGMRFDLSAADNSSDLLDLTGYAFTKGTTGSSFLFDFTGGKAGETYTLVQFDSTTFNVGDFATTVGSIDGSFNLTGSSLEFTAVPEPGSLALMGIGGLLIARRRRG